MSALEKKTLQELKGLMGDAYQSIFDAFNNSAQKCVEDLQQAINNKDIHKIERSSHTLKGSSANVGAMRLSKLCDLIVSKARNSDNDGYNDYFDKVMDEYNKVKTEIVELFEK